MHCRLPYSVLTVLLLACSAFAQAAPVPQDPKLPGELKELKAMVARPKMEDDFRAVDLIQTLMKGIDQRNPKDSELIAKALGDAFQNGKVRPLDSMHLYDEAAKSLSLLGAIGARELYKAVTSPRFKSRDNAKVRAKLLAALGKTKDEKQVDFLLEQALRSPDDEVIGAAGEALGNFTELEISRRRDVVKQLVSRYGEWDLKASRPDSNDPNAPIDFSLQDARKTLSRIQGGWNSALSSLTGQTFNTAPDWQRFTNKNKDWTPSGGKK
ncbi:hypothetical protein LBMAG49_05310 [Planctomycetota bacterium]|nr:hypothetical protein LBMAG49_05310 [Planctomycetota bacterium]